MAPGDKPLVWLHGEIRTPPFSPEGRVRAGVLLRRLQHGERLYMPHARPMPSIGARCHELRISDRGQPWRIVYRIDDDAIVVVAVFRKQSRRTPDLIVADCQRRLQSYDSLGAR